MTPSEEDPYPDEEFPWNFYFNGVLMPKWGYCWPSECIDHVLAEKKWDNDVGERDIYFIYCRIDHVGVSESADSAFFVYAVQGILCKLLGQSDEAMKWIRSNPAFSDAEEVYEGLVSAAFKMRQLVLENGIAMWTSGYEQDRLRLVEDMRLAQLPESDPDYKPLPHRRRIAAEVNGYIEDQRARLHGLAHSGKFPKALRKQLLEI